MRRRLELFQLGQRVVAFERDFAQLSPVGFRFRIEILQFGWRTDRNAPQPVRIFAVRLQLHVRAFRVDVGSAHVIDQPVDVGLDGQHDFLGDGAEFAQFLLFNRIGWRGKVETLDSDVWNAR